MTIADLPALAVEIRQFLIASISQTGGHIGANLGTIELILALHYVFDSPQDKLLFDTGHAAYTHRILTGRAAQFSTLNTFGGMSRFLQRSDSIHDIIDATHAGTAISTAVGLAQAMQMIGDPHHVIVVVGDGTLGEGLAWEGLNYLAGTNLPIIVIINDNGMAIAPTVGGIANVRESLFDGLGFGYCRVENGHDIAELIDICTEAKRYCSSPFIMHVKTEKGRGLPCAANHAYKMHFSMPFDPLTGAGASPTIAGRTYATIAAETLGSILAADPDVVVLTPGTPYASGLEPLMERFPDRVVDIGMAEQHAVSMAAGLALVGKKLVVCFQSTFMQRAYDQILHDVCYMNLPVTFLCVRSGFAGYDGPTHHGLWDIPVLRSFPNMQLHYAMNTQDLQETLTARLEHPQGPLALLMPYEPIQEPEPEIGIRYAGSGIVAAGKHGMLLCLGNTLATAHAVRHQLDIQHSIDVGLVVFGQLKPLLSLPKRMSRALLAYDGSTPPAASFHIVTIEEGMLAGGFGSLVAEAFLDADIPVSLLRCGTGDHFVPAGSKQECAQATGLDVETITNAIVNRWAEGTR